MASGADSASGRPAGGGRAPEHGDCVLITGAAGYLGTLTAQAIRSVRPDLRLLGVDRIRGDAPVDWLIADVAAPDTLRSIAWHEVAAVLHLPALTTMSAERDFDAALHLNVTATVALLEACRAEGGRRGRPLRFVFPSSLAVFGGGQATVDERSPVRPSSTYGFSKVIVEQYVAEFSRRGFIDGVTLRLPVCIVRPGRTLRTSAGFLSDLVCAAAAGRPLALPMPARRRIPVADNAAAAGALATLALGPGWSALPPLRQPPTLLQAPALLHLPALSVCAEDLFASLIELGIAIDRRDYPVAIDAEVMRVTAGWPTRFGTSHPEALANFRSGSMREILARFLAGVSRRGPTPR